MLVTLAAVFPTLPCTKHFWVESVYQKQNAKVKISLRLQRLLFGQYAASFVIENTKKVQNVAILKSPICWRLTEGHDRR